MNKMSESLHALNLYVWHLLVSGVNQDLGLYSQRIFLRGEILKNGHVNYNIDT